MGLSNVHDETRTIPPHPRLQQSSVFRQKEQFDLTWKEEKLTHFETECEEAKESRAETMA